MLDAAQKVLCQGLRLLTIFRATLKLTSMSHTPKKWKLPPNVETHLVLLESHGMLVAGQAPKVRVSRYTTCSEMFVSKGHHIPIDESCSPYFPGFNISVLYIYILHTLVKYVLHMHVHVLYNHIIFIHIERRFTKLKQGHLEAGSPGKQLHTKKKTTRPLAGTSISAPVKLKVTGRGKVLTSKCRPS